MRGARRSGRASCKTRCARTSFAAFSESAGPARTGEIQWKSAVARDARPMRTVHVPQRILLTGATGVLGRQLLPTLAGWRAPIRVLAHRIDPLPTPSLPLERHRGDLEHPVTLHGMAEDCD